MTGRTPRLFVTALCIGLFSFSGVSRAVDFSAAAVSVFVDFDGDGFNDTIKDNNHNGIPDRFELDFEKNAGNVESILGDAFAGIESEIPDDLLSNTDKFSLRKFETRALWQCHRGFSADERFGPGNGIGLGAKACAGGNCGI